MAPGRKKKNKKNPTFAFKIDPVIVLTASSFKHPTISVNQYVDNESNQAVMGMTFWTKKGSLCFSQRQCPRY